MTFSRNRYKITIFHNPRLFLMVNIKAEKFNNSLMRTTNSIQSIQISTQVLRFYLPHFVNK